MGDTLHAASRCRDCGWFAQSGEFRSGAGHLYVRVIFATWGVVYHYNVWLDKPPTRMYWRRGWELFRSQGIFRSVSHSCGDRPKHRGADVHRQTVASPLVDAPIPLLGLSSGRGRLPFRWCSAGSHFGHFPNDQSTYVTYLFGFPAGAFPLHTLAAFLLFHGLDIAAVLVIAGVALSLWRRLRDKGAQTLQSFAMDFFPLILLFAISVTGIALTVSQEWLRGALTVSSRLSMPSPSSRHCCIFLLGSSFIFFSVRRNLA